MKVLLVGTGRMGCALAEVLRESGHEIVARVGRRGDEAGRSLGDVLAAARPDVALEFTTPTAAPEIVPRVLAAKIPVVSGTTGWEVALTARQADELGMPLLVSPNFSIGVAVLRRLVALAAAGLSAFDEFEPAIVERHHRAKKDQPSGTARALQDAIIAASRWQDVPAVSLRQGGQPGEHLVYFEGRSECLTLAHSVRDRRVFAAGAVRAAEWLCRERPRGFVTFDTFLERTLRWNAA